MLVCYCGGDGRAFEPDAETAEYLLNVLGEFVARAGAGPLLRPPVEPGEAPFPEPWAATRAGVALLLRRLAWHAGLDHPIEIEDGQVGARPTEEQLEDAEDRAAT